MENQINYYQNLAVGDRLVIDINSNLKLSIKREAEGYVFDAYAPKLGEDVVIPLGYIFNDDLENFEED